jgi:hypothetical protein
MKLHPFLFPTLLPSLPPYLRHELADRQAVLVLDLVEEGQGVGLHHFVGGVDGLLHLVHPG